MVPERAFTTFSLFAIPFSATSMQLFAIATLLIFWVLQSAIRYLLSQLPLASVMGFLLVNCLNFMQGCGSRLT
jgi:hypothetical protein